MYRETEEIPRFLLFLKEEFLCLDNPDLMDWIILCVGTVLCVVGYLASSSTHYKPVRHTDMHTHPQSWQPKTLPGVAQCPIWVQIYPQLKTTDVEDINPNQVIF